MDYPQEFSRQARARVEGAAIRARDMFIANQKNLALGLQGLASPKGASAAYLQNVFFAFAQEACAIGKNGIWSADEIDRGVKDAVDSIAREVQRECTHLGFRSGWMFNRDNHVSDELWGDLKTSGSWTLSRRDIIEEGRGRTGDHP